MAAITTQQLEDASVDVDDFENFMNQDENFGSSGVFTSRLGQQLTTLKRIITDLQTTEVTVIASTAESKDFPFVLKSQNDFTTDILGFSVFNGGSISHDSGNNRLSVSGNNGQGVIFDYTNQSSTKMILQVSIVTGGNTVNVYSQWSTQVGTISADGTYTFEFTTDASAGGFGNKVVLTCTGSGQNFYVTDIRLYEDNNNSIYLKDSEIRDLINLSSGSYFTYDFSQENLDTQYITTFSSSYTVANDVLTFSPTSNGQVLVFKYTESGADVNTLDYVFVELEVDHTDDFYVDFLWTNQGTRYVVDSSGKHFFVLNRIGTQANTELQGLCFSSVDSGGGTIDIKNITVKPLTNGLDALTNVIIGQDAQSTTPLDTDKGVVIGANANTNIQGPVLIGKNAKGLHTTYYSGGEGIFGANSNNELVGIGEDVVCFGWRTTAVGAKAIAGGQSSTAMGAGAVALQSHSVAIGRGAYSPDFAHVGFSAPTIISNRDIYFENGYGHKFNRPYSELTIGDCVPNTITVNIYGQDAFDARYEAWSSSTNYTTNGGDDRQSDVIQHNNVAYKAIADSLDVEPGVDSGWEGSWVQLQTLGSEGTPSEFNVDGGHIRLWAGRPTGSGTGGSAGFKVADGTNLGNNVKQNGVDALWVEADSGLANTFMCYRKTDGTLKRINEEADGTLKGIAY